MRRKEDDYTKQQMREELNIELSQVPAALLHLLKLVYAKTGKQSKELGMPPKDSPDNEETYTGDSVRRLKAELEKRQKENE